MSATIIQRKKWGRKEERGIISCQEETYYFLPLLKSTEKTAVRGSEVAKYVLWYALSDYKGKEISCQW